MDFINAISPLAYSPGVNVQCTNISIVNDTTLENDERFFVQLTTTDVDIDLAPSVAEVIISDDDGECYSVQRCKQAAC